MDDSQNPANIASKRITDETRVPMSLPQLMLEVPKIEGYVLHWFADRPGRISRATRGGYEFVDPSEVSVNNFGLAEDLLKDGNTDLGTRVSVLGGTDEKGGPERLYLMKVKQAWYDKDMALREEASERVVQALKHGTVGAEKERLDDARLRYARGTDNIFNRKRKV